MFQTNIFDGFINWIKSWQLTLINCMLSKAQRGGLSRNEMSGHGQHPLLSFPSFNDTLFPAIYVFKINIIFWHIINFTGQELLKRNILSKENKINT